MVMTKDDNYLILKINCLFVEIFLFFQKDLPPPGLHIRLIGHNTSFITPLCDITLSIWLNRENIVIYMCLMEMKIFIPNKSKWP